MRRDGQTDRHDESNRRFSLFCETRPNFRLTAVSRSFLAIRPTDAPAYPEEVPFSSTAFMKQLFELFIFVAVLCYESECRWFDSRWCHSIISLKLSFRSHYDPGVDSAFNRNEYQGHFLGVKAAAA